MGAAPLTDEVVDAYLDRIGAERPGDIDPGSLATLQRSHLDRVPFENLDIHLGVPIELDLDRIVDKIVNRRRGGFCYELNGAFAALLGTIGYDVDLLAARVHQGGRLGPPFDHMVLRVATAGASWLVDVGFGASFRNPIRSDLRTEQVDPAGVYRLVDADGGVDLFQDGVAQFRFDRRPHRFADFAPGCRFHQTSESHFTRAVVCSLPTADGGRRTIRNSTLITTAPDGTRSERTVEPGDLRHLYRTDFGIDLPAVPAAPPQG